MKPIPQMLTDETLRARYPEAIRRTSVLPVGTSAAELGRDIATTITELEEEIAELAQELRRRRLPVEVEGAAKAAQVPSDPATDDLTVLSEDALRVRLANASKELCTISVRSKRGKQLKRTTTNVEHELRRRGLPLPIDAEVARLK